MFLLIVDDFFVVNCVLGFMIEVFCMILGGGDRGIIYIILSCLDWDDFDSDIFCGNVIF